ncbi:Succinyl-CoA-L-malate CoA-transferase beta subunit [Daldinia childiae]|uniref:Succinyl-CoA-L-malate CoA-transferase beta subunit n=1 Tax=Daldinia childiae TaxID=326645 RepID=UPI001445778C|nr:Succinyl-CoA-L-malate CoA-transferase beta subunit [Daldinia childiae]KAF3061837.1 Succinyl-CoA-L-malate CoA-transferase beta subunit [Daldinia childiae]
MGSIGYSVPQEAQRLFQDGILNNPLMEGLPQELQSLSKTVHFEGSAKPSIPINWRFAESISAIKAFEATMLTYLITKKYNVAPSNVSINTDHASLFFMSPFVARVVKDGSPARINLFSKEISKWFPNHDLHRAAGSHHRTLATNIYKTKDGQFYHIHGSMNPNPTLTALGLPFNGEENDTYDSAVKRIQGIMSQFDSAALDELINEQYRQAGTIVWTSDEYFASEHGQASGKIGLYETIKDSNSSQSAAWWPDNASYPSSAKRPLAGLKVVDLARVIAGPTITRSLAEMGASVMRVTSPNITDISALHQDLNWGKWNCFLNLKNEADKEKLRALIQEADVVVDGYRPGVMERLGFGRQAIFDMVKDRSRGIIVVRENCYGWHGSWAHRSGWQQISDACCGVSMSYGRAMGNDEPVTPVFPNSDYCTGICGSIAVLEALVRRAEHGGSYGVDVALNYYSQWLVRSVGTYDDETWKEVWKRHGSPVFRHYHAMPHSLPAILKLLYQHDSQVLFNPAFFQEREAKNIGATFVQVKPVIQFADGAVDLGYHIGTRGNGVDEPIWPDNLTVEIVRSKD